MEVTATVGKETANGPPPAGRSTTHRKKHSKVRSWIGLTSVRILVAVVALAIWQGVVSLAGGASKAVLPAPTDVGLYLWNDVILHHTVLGDIWSTLIAIGISFFLGSALGIAIGFILVMSPPLERVLDFYLTLFNSFPRAALAPVFIALFGLGQGAKIVTAVTVIIFVVIIGTVSGAKNVDPDLAMLFRSVGAGRVSTFVKLILPWSIPSIFGSLKLALIYSALGVVVTEMLGGSSGLGYEVNTLANTFRMDGVIGLLFVLAIITVCLAGVMNLIERRLTRWK